MVVFIVANEEEQETLCQRFEALANTSEKRFHTINFKAATINDFRGAPQVSEGSYVLKKPDWIGEDSLWLLVTNLTDGLDDPDNARIKFSMVVKLMPAAARDAGLGAITLPQGSTVHGVVTRDKLKDLKFLLDSLSPAIRSRVQSSFIERNEEGFWQEMKSKN